MSQAREAVKRAIKLSEDDLAKQVISRLGELGMNPSRKEKNAIQLHYNNEVFTLEILHSIRVSQPDRTAIMDLLEDNMRALYEKSREGWSRRAKQGELFDKSGRFLVLRNADSQLTAFVNWRFDCEECEPEDSQARPNEDIVEVLYCYEVQICAAYRARRLGRMLMDLLHAMAAQTRMRKVMLTVFLSNDPARRFYLQLGYISDLISPARERISNNNTDINDVRQQDIDYDILSRAII